eukprot:TRINITY_DN12726_c1_g1_i2.p1 TRINITY_DN12726_c1_g1~~TRINITY_DN12726_c1_g1_i2.p1  ORF type:complete len:183 (+),score=11.52 TRINITY_DN12726_c1_g1_i2:103-651(+)
MCRSLGCQGRRVPRVVLISCCGFAALRLWPGNLLCPSPLRSTPAIPRCYLAGDSLAAHLVQKRLNLRHVQRRGHNTGRYLVVNNRLGADEYCQLCGVDADLTIHHLIPRLQWKRMKRKGKLRGGNGNAEPPTAVLCRTCHNKVHNAYTHSELARRYSTVEELVEAEALQGYLQTRSRWVDGH